MRHTFRLFGVLIAVAAFSLIAVIPAFAQTSGAAMVRSVTTTTMAIPTPQCDQIKKAFPQHLSDPHLCQVVITHTLQGTPLALQSMQTHRYGSCSANGSDVQATDDLRYSYFWIVELYTHFRAHNWGCTPSLLDQNGFVKISFAATVSESRRVVTNGNMVTVIQDIQSTIFNPFPVSFHSCQSRGLNGWGDWPYRANLIGGGC
jgi:hypothetical protein